MAFGYTNLQVVTTARSTSWALQLSALQRSVKSITLEKFRKDLVESDRSRKNRLGRFWLGVVDGKQ